MPLNFSVLIRNLSPVTTVVLDLVVRIFVWLLNKLGTLFMSVPLSWPWMWCLYSEKLLVQMCAFSWEVLPQFGVSLSYTLKWKAVLSGKIKTEASEFLPYLSKLTTYLKVNIFSFCGMMTIRTVEHWIRLHREILQSPSLDVFKTWQNKTLTK